MSLTIGFAIRNATTSTRPDLSRWMVAEVARYGYRLSFDVTRAVLDVRPGIRCLETSWHTDFIGLMHAPEEEPWAIASQVGVELEERGRSRFLDLVRVVGSRLVSEEQGSVFFAVGWKSRVRRRVGTPQQLVELLTSECGWTEPLYDVCNDSIWCSDELPLFFTFA